MSCAVEGCDRLVYARGWCSAHYNRWQLTGDVKADQPIRALKRYGGKRGAVETISLVMRTDWPAQTRNQLAQLAKRAADGMSFEAYEAVRARILEGKA